MKSLKFRDHRRGGQFYYLLMLPFLILIPALVEFTTRTNGTTLDHALGAGWASLFGTPQGLLFWAGVLGVNLLLYWYLNPLRVSWCSDNACSRMGLQAARQAMGRLNYLGAFLISLSIAVSIAIHLLGNQHSEQAVFFQLPWLYTVGESTATGALTGVLLWVMTDNFLFPSRKNLAQNFPELLPMRTSLFAKIMVIFLAVIAFLVFQVFSTSGAFFRRGMGFPGNPDLMGPQALAQMTKGASGIHETMAVFYWRIGTFFLFFLVLLKEVKTMIIRPLGIIRQRLKAINDGNAGGTREIQVIQNDEFAPVYQEVNRLVRRQDLELQASKTQLDSIYETAADPIIVYDQEGRVLRFNPAAEAYFGLPGDQVLGKRIHDLIALDKPEYLFMEAHHDHRGDAGSFKDLVRMQSKRTDGPVRNFEAHASRVICADHVEYTVVLRDIEAQLLVERTLREATQAAENANRMKSEFLATMSHELRTPLNAVLGFAQLLSVDRNLTESQREKIQIINRSGEHLLALINDILDISKIEAGKVDMHPVVFDIHEFVQDVEDMFALKCRKKGLNLYVEWVNEVPRYVRGDLGKLRQVVVNLVGNAVKFTAEGGIGIAVGLDEGRYRFSVTDSGRGIPEAEQGSILQPFVQSSLTDHESGTGLGLAISSRFVAMMGGELTVRSQVGKGSTFSFSIPLEATDQTPVEQDTECEPAGILSGADKPILIVDDKVTNRLVLKEMLGSVGFSSMEAEHGQEAVDRTREIKPRVVLMDIRMPVMDGYEAVKLIKADPELKDTKVFALTASAFRHDEEQILGVGFDGFLAKPFKRSSLFALLRDKTDIRMEFTAPRTPEPSTAALDLSDLDPSAWVGLDSATLRRLEEATLINDFTAVATLGEDLDRSGDAGLRNLGRVLRTLAHQFDEDSLSRLVADIRKDHGR